MGELQGKTHRQSEPMPAWATACRPALKNLRFEGDFRAICGERLSARHVAEKRLSEAYNDAMAKSRRDFLAGASVLMAAATACNEANQVAAEPGRPLVRKSCLPMRTTI